MRAGAEVVAQLAGLVSGGRPLAPGTVDMVADAVEGAEPIGPMLDDVVWRHGQTASRPRTAGQKRYADAIRSATITFGIGPAGTGKTYLAVAAATAALTRREVARIILTRPGRRGRRAARASCPATSRPRSTPTCARCSTPCTTCSTPSGSRPLFERGQIEVAPLAFMRGRTLNDSFIILDEAQNTTPEQMKMFLTRLGYGSRMVVTGDITQIDLPTAQQLGPDGGDRRAGGRRGHRLRAPRPARRGAPSPGAAHRGRLRRGGGPRAGAHDRGRGTRRGRGHRPARRAPGVDVRAARAWSARRWA